MTTKPTPTAEQINALLRFAERNGDQWKWKLLNAWDRGAYGAHDAAHLLQQLRNQQGGAWLAAFSLADELERERLDIAHLIEYAETHYNKGFDTFVECYSRPEWIEIYTNGGRTYKGALDLMSRIAGVYLERQHDAAYHANGGAY